MAKKSKSKSKHTRKKGGTTQRKPYKKKWKMGGNMKNLFSTLIVGAIIVGCFWAYDYNQKMAQTWQAEAQYKLEQKIREDERNQAARYARAQWWAENTGRVYTGVALTGFLAIGLAGYIVYDRRREAHNRAVDGMFPLQQMKMGANWLLVNPNNAPLPILNVSQPQLPLSQGDYILQSEMNKGASKVALAQAKASRAMPIRYAAEAKLDAGYWDREPQGQNRFKIAEAEAPLLEAPPVKRFEFGEAIAQSDKFNWVVGQESDTEELMRFNFTKQSHALVCGSTNCGKTSSTGYLLALMALKSKMHVCIFDGAGGADWLPFEHHTEFKLVQPEDLIHIIDRIEQLYEERQEDLRAAGVADNYHLKPPLQPIIIILDEVGFLLAGFKQKEKTEVTDRLSRLIRVIRKAGIHLVLIDQNVSSLPSQLLTNINCIFAYKAEGMASNAIKRYNLDKLKPQGQYDYNGRVTDAWHTAKFLDEHLNGLKPVKAKYFFADNVIDNKGGGGFSDKNDVIPTPLAIIDKSGNTRVTSGKMGDNSDNKVVTALSLNGAPVTQEEKDKVYQIYLETGKKKNETCRRVWGGTGGYLRYLNAVIEEMEDTNVTA